MRTIADASTLNVNGAWVATERVGRDILINVKVS